MKRKPRPNIPPKRCPPPPKSDARPALRKYVPVEISPLLAEALHATGIIGQIFFENPSGPPDGPSIAQRYLAAARGLIAKARELHGISTP